MFMKAEDGQREPNEACSTDGGLGDQNEDNDTNLNQMDISPPNGNDCMIPSPADISHSKQENDHQYATVDLSGLTMYNPNYKKCCVVGCDYRIKHDGRHFHKFPWFNLKLLEQWLERLARDCNGVPWFPRKSDRVCSNHFHPYDLQELKKSNARRLSHTAIPSILPDVYQLKKATVEDTKSFYEINTSVVGGPQPANRISCEPVTHIILNDDDIDQTGSFQCQDNETDPEQVMRIQIPLVDEEILALTREYVQLCNTMRQLKEMAKVNLDLLYLSADVCKNQEARQEVEKVQDLINYLVKHSQVFKIEVYTNEEAIKSKDAEKAKEAETENLERRAASDAYENAMTKREPNEACRTDGGLGDQNEDNDTNINQMDRSPQNGNDCMIPSPADISHSKQENDYHNTTVVSSTNQKASGDTHFNLNPATSYACQFCDQKTYDNKKDLFIHLEREHRDQPFFTCIICNKQFTDIQELRHHQGSHRNRKRDQNLQHLTCTVCLSQFISPELLSIHENYHKKQSLLSHVQTDFEADYPCVFCDLKLQTETHFRKHLETNHADLLFYTCTICSKQFKKLRLIHDHKRRRCARYYHVCKICSKHFKSFELFSSHQNYHKKHGSEECQLRLPHTDYPCEFCDVKLPTEADLRKHYETEPGHYCICNICSKPIRFGLFGYHRRGHRRGHVKETDAHLCPFCGRQFKLLAYLKKHIKVHEKYEKMNTQCTKCGITFESDAQLKEHKKAHEERPSKEVCPICGKMVNGKNLKLHIRIHKEKNQVQFPCKYSTHGI